MLSRMSSIYLRVTVSAALLSIAAALGCLPDGKMKIPYNDRPRELHDGWPISTPAAEGFDPEKLRGAYRQFFDEDRFVTAISLLVIRHGKLVAEGYCRSLDDIDQLNAIQSATKSVTSLLTGIAIADGSLEGVDQTIYDLIPDKFDDDPKKKTITVEDALTMRTGIAFDNDSFSEEVLIEGTSDSLRYILTKPLGAEPGTLFEYEDCNPHLLGGAIQRAVGTSMEAFAQARLFGPLGIDDYIWEMYGDGITYGAVGLYLKPRDLAKIGLLALRDGNWQGQQIVPAEWIAKSTSSVVDTPATPDLGFRYGYYWWTIDRLGAFTADGHGGQYAFVVPERDLVIAFTAEPHTNGDTVSINLEEFEILAEAIIGAIVD